MWWHRRRDQCHGHGGTTSRLEDKMMDFVAAAWDHLLLFGKLKHPRPSPCPLLLARHYSPPKLCTCTMV